MENNLKTGYTMNEARAIILHSPAKTVILREDDPDYPAMVELRRVQLAGVDPLIYAEMAFSLGRAIGIRDERARRNGIMLKKHERSTIVTAKQEYHAEARKAEARWRNKELNQSGRKD